MERAADVSTQPCGHTSLCKLCVKKVSRCPRCNVVFKSWELATKAVIEPAAGCDGELFRLAYPDAVRTSSPLIVTVTHSDRELLRPGGLPHVPFCNWTHCCLELT